MAPMVIRCVLTIGSVGVDTVLGERRLRLRRTILRTKCHSGAGNYRDFQ